MIARGYFAENKAKVENGKDGNTIVLGSYRINEYLIHNQQFIMRKYLIFNC